MFTIGFPPVLDAWSDFEKCKSNIFLIRKVMNLKISFQQIQPFIYGIYIYLALKYGNIKVNLYLKRNGASRVVAI